MKPKIIDFVPLIGLAAYFMRYAKSSYGQYNGYKEDLITCWMELYHLVVSIGGGAVLTFTALR